MSDEYTYDDFLAEPEYVGEEEDDYDDDDDNETQSDIEDEINDEEIEEMIRTGRCCGGDKWKGHSIDLDELEERNILMLDIRADVRNGLSVDDITLKYINADNKYINIKEFVKYIFKQENREIR